MSGKLRPWCCPDQRCEPVHLLADSIALAHGIQNPQPGQSFFCFGRMAEPNGSVKRVKLRDAR